MEEILVKTLKFRRVKNMEIATIGKWQITLLPVKEKRGNRTLIVFSDRKNGCHITSYSSLPGESIGIYWAAGKVRKFFESPKLDSYLK